MGKEGHDGEQKKNLHRGVGELTQPNPREAEQKVNFSAGALKSAEIRTHHQRRGLLLVKNARNMESSMYQQRNKRKTKQSSNGGYERNIRLPTDGAEKNSGKKT